MAGQQEWEVPPSLPWFSIQPTHHDYLGVREKMHHDLKRLAEIYAKGLVECAARYAEPGAVEPGTVVGIGWYLDVQTPEKQEGIRLKGIEVLSKP